MKFKYLKLTILATTFVGAVCAQGDINKAMDAFLTIADFESPVACLPEEALPVIIENLQDIQGLEPLVANLKDLKSRYDANDSAMRIGLCVIKCFKSAKSIAKLLPGEKGERVRSQIDEVTSSSGINFLMDLHKEYQTERETRENLAKKPAAQKSMTMAECPKLKEFNKYVAAHPGCIMKKHLPSCTVCGSLHPNIKDNF